MGDEARNKAIFAEAHQKWHATRGGSVDHWMGLLDENVDFRSLAAGADPGPFTATRSNRDQAGQYLAELVGGWTMLHYTINHYVAEGDRVVSIGSTAWTNKKTGKTVETPKVDVARFRDGKIIEFFEYYDTAKLYAAATP